MTKPIKKAARLFIFAVSSMAMPVAWSGSGNDTAHWSYEGHGAPEYWGDLKAEYATCKTGKSQSPINISGAKAANLPAIQFNYQPNSLDVVNNGHTIKVGYKNGSSITVDGKKYELLQFHFHSPSEHEIDGKPADMVAHLVHKAADGQLAVVAVLMKKGEQNAELAKVWKHMPKHEGEHNKAATELKLANLLPADMEYFQYSGSLTTPPCSEGVNWMVLKTPVEVSAEQIAAFSRIFPKSTRPVQPLNGREIKVKS